MMTFKRKKSIFWWSVRRSLTHIHPQHVLYAFKKRWILMVHKRIWLGFQCPPCGHKLIKVMHGKPKLDVFLKQIWLLCSLFVLFRSMDTVGNRPSFYHFAHRGTKQYADEPEEERWNLIKSKEHAVSTAILGITFMESSSFFETSYLLEHCEGFVLV